MMSSVTYVVLVIAALFTFIPEQVNGNSEVKIWFERFINPKGTGSNGHCCDGRWKVCIKGKSGGCDHKFTICLDSSDSGKGVGPSNCLYGRVQTSAISDMDNVTFGSMIANIHNPIIFRIPGAMPNSLALKVDVYDEDPKLPGNFLGSDDHVDFLQTTLMANQHDLMTSHPKQYTIQGHTSLTVTVTIQCAPNYYTQDCSRLCEPPQPGQHYICDPITGFKVYSKNGK